MIAASSIGSVDSMIWILFLSGGIRCRSNDLRTGSSKIGPALTEPPKREDLAGLEEENWFMSNESD